MIYSRIAGTGRYLPERIMTNADLEKIVDTSDEWIRTRTGVERRHVASEDETTSDMCVEAAKRAMDAAGVSKDDIDFIAIGTTSPDLVFPNIATLVQERLDIQRSVVMNEKRQNYDDQPYGRVRGLTRRLMYPDDHPYSWIPIGSMEDLQAASLEDVKDFFRQYYTPNNASLCIAGDFNPDEAKAWVEKYFGPIPAGPPIERLQEWVPVSLIASLMQLTIWWCGRRSIFQIVKISVNTLRSKNNGKRYMKTS